MLDVWTFDDLVYSIEAVLAYRQERDIRKANLLGRLAGSEKDIAKPRRKKQEPAKRQMSMADHEAFAQGMGMPVVDWTPPPEEKPPPVIEQETEI